MYKKSRLLKARLLRIHFNKSTSYGHTTKQAGQQGKMALSINVPALTANISVVATNRTNIHNKTGNVCQ